MPGNALIQLRRDTAANWAATNPVLALAEPGLETDTGKIKYGDGVSAWSALSYWSGGGAVSDGDKGDISILAGVWSVKANAPNILNKVIATDRASMAGLNTVQIAYLEGTPWAFASGDQSALVTADPNQIVAVAPTSDTTGHSGAWIKQFSGPVWADWFGVSTSSADNYAAFNRARTVANALARVLKVKAGVFIFNQATPSFVLVDYEQIDGSGAGTVFHFTDTLASAGTIFLATGKKNIRLTNFRFEANSLRTSSNQGIWFQDCVDCYAENVSSDKWTQPFISDRTNPGGTTIPPATTNLRNKFVRCISYSSRSYGFFIQFGTACALIDCEAYASSAYDGFKLGGGNMFCKVRGCHSEGNAADGFDTYDGWITCSISDCTAFNNGAQGFQFKGHFGGSYGATDYVTRESAYSNLLAKGNGLSGFLFQETRLGGCSNLVAIGNGTAGFVLNNIQGFAFSACVANRNTQHGWVFLSTSRCTFSSCNAIDNSFVDGTVQNGLYDGFNFDSLTGNCYFGSCLSHNGTAAGLLGGQAYGFNLGTAAGNIFIGCAAISNITGPVGGTTPYDNNNFSLFQTPTSFLGWKATGAAGEQQLTSTSNVTAYLKRTGGAFLYLQSTATSALIGSVAAFPLTFSTNSSGRWNVTSSGHFSPVSDNAYDIGTTGTARVRNYFGAGNITIGGAVSASNVSGTNTGDQFTATAASKLLGRGSAAGAGAAQEITLGTNLSMSGTTLNASGAALADADYGDVVVAGGVWSLDPTAPNLVNKAQHVADRAALAAAGISVPVAYLREAGREGAFVWSAANLSAAVTADTAQGIYVPPSSDTTGASGAWVRKFSGLASVKWFGALGDDSHDDTAAIVAALASGFGIFFPAGIYRITSTITLSGGAFMVGAGRTRTILKSLVVGGSLFNTASGSQSFFYMAHMKCLGNGLTGASGSGHCFNFLNPNGTNTGASTWSPQNAQLEYIWITGFRGSDVGDYITAKVASAGVFQYNTIAVTCRHVYVSNCGHGFYLNNTQNCRLTDCVTDTIYKASLFDYANVNLAIEACDLVNGGLDNAIDAGYPTSAVGYGSIISYGSQGTVFTATKAKTYAGQALFVCMNGEATFTAACSLRGDNVNNAPGKAVLQSSGTKLAFTNTVFDPTTTSFPAQPYQTIELLSTQNAPAAQLTIDGCIFQDAAGQPIAYNIYIHGNNASRTAKLKIVNNQFGSRSSLSSASVVTNDITMDTITLAAGSEIGRNLHIAPTNVTRTACVNVGASVTLNNMPFWPSGFQPNGGTITANYSGATETLITGSNTGDQTIGLTGDATGSGTGTFAVTLATVNSNTGTFGGATTSPQFSVNGKGLVTGVTAVTITPAWASITSKPTTLSGFGITDGQPLNANLTAYAGANWSAGTQIPALTAANTIALKTVGAATGNILDKAAGDSLYQPVGSYLTANQTITLSGDASGSGTTAITVTIGANKVTRGMLAAAAGATILGATGAGNVTDLTAAQAKTFLAIAASDVSGLAAVATSGSGADITPSIQAVASAATVTPTFSNNMVKITAQAVGLTLANPTGTAVAGRKLVIRIKDNGTGQTIAYGTQYRAIGVTLPTTTVANKTLYLGLVYNSDDTKWDVVAVSQEA